jgi:anti-sigma regulatory factor (Ser/Thr protein kinase)
VNSRAGAVAAEHGTRAAPGNGGAPDSVLRLCALDLPSLPEAVTSARLHARRVICEWGLAAIGGDAELIVSELVTNAITHGTRWSGTADAPPIRLRLTRRSRGVYIEVWDACDEMPQVRCDPLGEEIGGRGLILVAAIAIRWGAYRAKGGGKCVFAVVGA